MRSCDTVNVLRFFFNFNGEERVLGIKLAEDGFNAFAIDMYGDGNVGESNEENQSMMQPLLDDRKNLSQIIVGAYEAAKKLEGYKSLKKGPLIELLKSSE